MKELKQTHVTNGCNSAFCKTNLNKRWSLKGKGQLAGSHGDLEVKESGSTKNGKHKEAFDFPLLCTL